MKAARMIHTFRNSVGGKSHGVRNWLCGDLERRRVIHRAMQKCFGSRSGSGERLENSFQKRQSCLAAFVFHFQTASAASFHSRLDRGHRSRRHFHDDQETGEKVRVGACHVSRHVTGNLLYRSNLGKRRFPRGGEERAAALNPRSYF